MRSRPNKSPIKCQETLLYFPHLHLFFPVFWGSFWFLRMFFLARTLQLYLFIQQKLKAVELASLAPVSRLEAFKLSDWRPPELSTKLATQSFPSYQHFWCIWNFLTRARAVTVWVCVACVYLLIIALLIRHAVPLSLAGSKAFKCTRDTCVC